MADLIEGEGAPVDEDRRFDDEEFNPQLEPKKAQAWLNLLEESEKAFETWNDHCDKIEKSYANIDRLATAGRDKQFQMLWANLEVEKPTIYARPPVPVVVTKFKDQRPVYNAAAELLERVNVCAFDMVRIDDLMKLVRDNIVLHSRGVAWCRYERSKSNGSYYDSERVCIDFKHRRDFLHSISRNWPEVWWVAGASYLTRQEARNRFFQFSGDEYQDADYTIDKDTRDIGGTDKRERAVFWEIWDKKNRRTVWVAKGCENILDEGDPELDLQNFFPCPQPAYGVCQPGSLVPVPDALQYWDQLEEINKLTAKIHALTDALEAKGFYPSGGAEVGPAIEAALAQSTPGRMLVPVANWAAFGGTKEVIIWLPIAEIASTIQACVEQRKQIVQDVYEIKGLSDIMRGASDPRETMGAQEIKTEYGSIRIRDKQSSLVRFARDLVVIATDIICDKFSDKTIIYMSQTQLPTKKMVEEQARGIAQQLQQQQQLQQLAPQSPEMQQMQQSNPDQFAQIMGALQVAQQSGQQSLQGAARQPTFEQVMQVLRDDRARCFILDIETDSTIMIDENTTKQRVAEFMGVLAQLLPQLAQMLTAEPMTAPFCGELLKFATAPYRAGRALEGSIDNLTQIMQEKASQPKGDDPATAAGKIQLQIEQMKDATVQKRDQADIQLKAQELKQKDQHERDKMASHERIEAAKLQQHQQDNSADASQTNLEMLQQREAHQQTMLESVGNLALQREKLDQSREQHEQRTQDFAQKSQDRRAMDQMRFSREMMQPRPPVSGAPA